jgi:hypothetical protein
MAAARAGVARKRDAAPSRDRRREQPRSLLRPRAIDEKPSRAILALAGEVGADLIIVGSHGLTGVERLLLGSTSETVVREAKCSVEVARPKRYPEVELANVVEVERDLDHPYVPPHRYEYEDHRTCAPEWPLY